MPKKYKVWVQIEEYDKEADDYSNIGEEEDVAEFDTLEAAVAFRDKISDIPTDPDTVTWRMPSDAAITLRQTLEMDAESGAFDTALREEIQEALDSIKGDDE